MGWDREGTVCRTTATTTQVISFSCARSIVPRETISSFVVSKVLQCESENRVVAPVKILYRSNDNLVGLMDVVDSRSVCLMDVALEDTRWTHYTVQYMLHQTDQLLQRVHFSSADCEGFIVLPTYRYTGQLPLGATPLCTFYNVMFVFEINLDS